jgi:hypothetical protein
MWCFLVINQQMSFLSGYHCCLIFVKSQARNSTQRLALLTEVFHSHSRQYENITVTRATFILIHILPNSLFTNQFSVLCYLITVFVYEKSETWQINFQEYLKVRERWPYITVSLVHAGLVLYVWYASCRWVIYVCIIIFIIPVQV